MPQDPNWIRWIVASANKHFRESLTAGGLSSYLEGEDRRTDHLEDYAEIRYTGPRFREESRDYWCVEIDLDVLVVSKANDRNIYTPEVDTGVVLAAFTREIGVFKLGRGPNDDPNVQLGCLELAPPEDIRVTNFGYPKDQVRLRQASVDATYRMYLTT